MGGNTLIVEDELDAAEELKKQINKTRPATNYDIYIEKEYEKAEKHLLYKRYDFIFCDLLLLPGEKEISEGRLKCDKEGVDRYFQTSDWEEYVFEKGGVGLIQSLRRGELNAKEHYSTQPGIPIVITSYFDAMPGFRNVVGATQFNDYETVILPKIFKNPAYDYSDSPDLLEDTRNIIRETLNKNFDTAYQYGQQMRERLLHKRWNDVDDRIIEPLGDYKQIRDIIATSTELIICIDPTDDRKLDWKCARSTVSDPYDLKFLHEEWTTLRNKILLNPSVNADFGLRPKNLIRKESEDLEWLSFGSNQEAALRSKCILTYLSFYAEPPQGVVIDEEYVSKGWYITRKNLQDGITRDIENINPLNVEDGTTWKFPNRGQGEPIVLSSFRLMNENSAPVPDYVSYLRWITLL